MLEAAQNRKQEGIDVVIGYIEKHDRSDTIALMRGLECIPLKIDIMAYSLQSLI
ncbi:MAG: hypothetical protein ACLT16_10510 [[Clostridium] innocuum]